MKALLVVAAMAVATALVSGALLVGRGNPPAAPAPPPAPAAEDRAALADLERKVRALEARIEELAARSVPVPDLPPGSRPTDGPPAADPHPQEPVTGGTTESGDAESASPADRVERRLKSLAGEVGGVQRALRDSEIRRRVDRAVVAMNLTPQEKERVEEIARAHIEKVDAIGLRAREALGNSPYGFTEADRLLVKQLSQERASLDKETEQAIVQFVGPERWKAGLKAEKDQEAKEKALERLERPW